MHFRDKDGGAQFRRGSSSLVLGDLRAWSGVVARGLRLGMTGEGEQVTKIAKAHLPKDSSQSSAATVFFISHGACPDGYEG